MASQEGKIHGHQRPLFFFSFFSFNIYLTLLFSEFILDFSPGMGSVLGIKTQIIKLLK